MFEKGNTQGQGRPKGSLNKATTFIKDAYKKIIENNLEGLQNDLKDLEPKDRIKLLLEMASFVVPKLKAVEIDAKIESNNTFLESLDLFSDEEIETMVLAKLEKDE